MFVVLAAAALPEALRMMAGGELLLVAAAAVCGAVACVLNLAMIARVNRLLPHVQRQSYLRWGAIRPLHRQMYPSSWMLAAVNFCIAGVIVCVAAAALFF